MARDNVALETDVAGKPVPQYRGANGYEKLLGRNGASRVELYGAGGQPVSLETLLGLLATAAKQDAAKDVLDLLATAAKQDAAKDVLDLLATEVTAAALLAEIEAQRHEESEPQNTTLIPGGPATTLTFTDECAYFDIFNEGPGDAWVKVDGTATIGGTGCLKLPEEMGYTLRQRGTTVSLIGTSASVVQVVGVR